MSNRGMLIRAVVGLVVAGAVAVPTLVSAAPPPAAVDVTHVLATSGGQCEITLTAAWNPTEINGQSVNVQLWQSVDGGEPTQVGVHERAQDDGSDSFIRRFLAPGTYEYEFRLTKGPKRLVGSGFSEAIVCAP